MSRDNLFTNAFYALLLCITAVSSAGTAALCIAAASASYETRQFNWIHGPGYPGPYQYWAKAFHTGENVYWENEGHIHLTISSSRHLLATESSWFVNPAEGNLRSTYCHRIGKLRLSSGRRYKWRWLFRYHCFQHL